MSIGKRLSRLRFEKRYNQKEFANILGISQQNLSNYENNKRKLPDAVKIKLQQIDVNIAWLLTGEGNMFIDRSRIKLNNVPNETKENPNNRLKSYPTDATNVAPVGKETKLSEQTDIQSSLEELAIKATAPQFENLKKALREMQERISKLERVSEKENTIASIDEKIVEQEKRIAEIERLLKKEFGKTEETKSPDTIYVAEPIVEYSATEDDIKTVDLPLAENLAAGVPIEACYNCETYAVPSKFLKKNKRYCVAKIKGTSMTDVGIADGSVVLLEYTNQANSGDIAVVTHDGYTTLKRLHQKDDGSWELRYEDGSGALIPLKDGAWDVLGAFVRVL